MNAPEITVASLGNVPCWVAWQSESRDGGKPTKIPYSHTGKKARADAPNTWGTRHQAEAMARTLPKPHGAGGVGIEFFAVDDQRRCGGIDLDTCRDPDTGTITPWARDIIDLFATYVEVSPSGTGVKAFFLYAAADLEKLRTAMGGSAYGRQFKRSGGDHPPAIELHLGNRYFAVTDQPIEDSPRHLRHVETSALLDLIQRIGPEFAKAETAAKPRQERAGSDGSRSSVALRKGAALRKAGKSFDQMCAALLADPDTVDWAKEKGRANNKREFKRIWEKAGDIAGTVAQVVAEFNEKYMVVNEGGKALVYAPSFDQAMRRRRFDRITFEHLRQFYMNRLIEVGADGKGNPVFRNAAGVWLSHAERRQFLGGVTFNPSGGTEQDTLNLWQGFAVTPKPGDWSILRDHIKTNICNADDVLYSYLMGWLARMFQRPAEQGEVAVVLRGGEGTGKGTLARAVRHIMGQHGMAISNAKHLVGNFNAHLRDAVFLFADESFFAGDRAHVGVLKGIITEQTVTIEGKYQAAVEVPNFLHIMMASNETWVVPASLDSRRFFVLEVGENVKSNHGYFASIWKQMEAGGYEAMLYDLLHLDLSDFNVRAVPTTEGLQEQRKLTLDTSNAWWIDCLHRGFVWRSKLGLEQHFSQWHDEVSTELLFGSYSDFATGRRERHPLSREHFGRFIRNFGARAKRLLNAATGEHVTDVDNPFGGTNRKAAVVVQPRPPGYTLGSLEAARDAFTAATGIAAAWPEFSEDEV